MEIRQAGTEMESAVHELCRSTIGEIYPKYYPRGAVDFFIEHHSIENIREDIRAGTVYLLYDGMSGEFGKPEELRGTVTVRGSDICRMFVPAAYQHRGYGQRLLDMAEELISGEYPRCIVHASFPAKHIYLKRGYREIEYNRMQTPCGDFLCWDIMEKVFPGHCSSGENSPIERNK